MIDDRTDSEKIAQIRCALPLPERREVYRECLLAELGKVEKGRYILRIPKLAGQRLRLPGYPFHAKPEIFFQGGGEKIFQFPDETIRLRAGEACLVPAGMPHREIARDKPGRFHDVIAMFRMDGFAFHFGFAAPTGAVRCGPYDFFPSARALRMARYLDEIAEAGQSSRTDPLVRGLYMAYLATAQEELKQSVPEPPVRNPLVVRSLTLVETELGRPELNIRWLAREVLCNPDYLARLFLKEMGEPIISYLQRRRIDYAKEMLEHSNLNTAEVGWASGFRHTSYFNRVFRALTNCTPKEYRRLAGRPQTAFL